MELYHGSEKQIKRPVFGFGNSHNDYGLGFYCTQSLEMACEWACLANHDGWANRYVLSMDGLSVLNLSSAEFHILNWLAVLLENRTFRLDSELARGARSYIAEHFLPAYKGYDIVCGYRADDSYFSFATSFLNGMISVEQLGKAMRLGNLGEQVVLRSEQAFGNIEFEGAELAPAVTWYPKRAARDLAARKAFREMRASGSLLEGHYVLDMLREGWDDDTPFLR
jgi:hypothetical protein